MSTTSTTTAQPTAQPAGAAEALSPGASRELLCTNWLTWLEEWLPNLRRAFILLDDGQGTLVTCAVQPKEADIEPSRALVLEAVGTQRPLARASGDAHELVFPIVGEQRVRGVVGLELVAADAASLAAATRTVQWGLGWLRHLLDGPGPGSAQQAAQLARAKQALDLSLLVSAEPEFRSASLALVNQLCRRFDCDAVQLGWCDAGSARLVARSNAAWHDGRTGIVRQAEQAMNEAVDQGEPVRLPATAEVRLTACRAARAYAQAAQATAVLVLPLRSNGAVLGALLFERAAPFDDAALDAAEAMALLITPVLQLRHVADESLWRHARRRATTWGGWLTGRRHLGWKLLGIGAAALLAIAALVPVTHRVTAPAVVEGRIQRVAAAPFAGYIRSAAARAGDVVKAGQVLAQLDDRDLVLERVRWEAELEVALRKEREAMAGADRVAMRLAGAQADQARAQLDLALEKLRRATLVAPFDAVVVKGDLSQQLGSPVETGKVLFELAPLEAWRVIVKVDERDIAWLATGQRGEIVLASLPGRRFEIGTQRVLSVAVAEEGRNHFRVEAGMGRDAASLRPGMEGVAKITVGEAPLLWVWTHRALDWLRRTAWEWTP